MTKSYRKSAMTAKIITLTQQKGGTGKSLISIQLAFALERMGYRVGVLDMGSLNVTSQWFSIAKEKGLESSVECIASADWRFQKDIETLNANGAAFILVDTASIQASDTQTQAALLMADLSIIPFQSGIIDEWAVDETIKYVNQHRVPYRMLRNRCCAINKPYTAARLMPFVLDSFLSDDPAYVNSLQSFTTLDEVATSATSLEEIKIFAQELCELVQPEQRANQAKPISSPYDAKAELASN